MKNAESQLSEKLRKCKDCKTPIGKGKQLCKGCRRERSNARKRKRPKGEWSVIANFKRDDGGRVIEKLCTSCREWLPTSGFNKRKDTPSGLVALCKTCSRESVNKRAKEKRAKLRVEWPPSTWFKECSCGKSFCSQERKKKYCSQECRNERRKTNQRVKNGSLYATCYFKCRKCKNVKHLKEFKKTKSTDIFKIAPSVCFACSEESRKKAARKSRQKPINKIKHNLRKRLSEVMNKTRKSSSGSLTAMTGCSSLLLRRHIESQFRRGMTWANYGKRWHIDHIHPVSAFDHSDAEQVKKCWHFSNLRPLDARENEEKGASPIDHQPELILTLRE